jgi:DNA-directed RNA polymerase II subunit RPB9
VCSDPTLPRSGDVQCPHCEHNEAVFFSLTTSEGMSLFFQCVSCAHKWKDEGGAI